MLFSNLLSYPKIILVISILILILSIILFYSTKKEGFGSYITPTQVEGAVRVGSTSLSGAVEFAQPNEECYSRCAAATLSSNYLVETEKDLRLQECRSQCGYLYQ